MIDVLSPSTGTDNIAIIGNIAHFLKAENRPKKTLNEQRDEEICLAVMQTVLRIQAYVICYNQVKTSAYLQSKWQTLLRFFRNTPEPEVIKNYHAQLS